MRSKLTRILFHIAAWLIFLSLPIVLSPQPPRSVLSEIGFIFLIPVIFKNAILIFIFYLNYYVLVPKYLFKKRYALYSIICIACILVVISTPLIGMGLLGKPEKPMLSDSHFQYGFVLFFQNNLLTFLVAFLASIGLALNVRWKQTEKERLSAQLSYLKTQINPHFLFNILNSIYSVTIGKAPQGAEMVYKLSEMMRYTLGEAQLDFVPLESEINYIANYIDMQKVRFDKSVKLSFDIDGSFSGKQIAPLLLIPFIENAFKHGVNSEQNSDIKIKIGLSENELHLQVINNKVEVEQDSETKSGLGIENTRNRLELIYPNKHVLNIIDDRFSFSVSLNIILA